MLDNHSVRRPPLGYVADAWVTDGMVKAKLVFSNTVAGYKAFTMAERQEVVGVSPGIEASEFVVRDQTGCEIEIEHGDAESYARDPRLTLVTMRSQLLEVSLTAARAKPETG
jgi:hypothetical protein